MIIKSEKNLVILENKTNSLKTLYFGNTGFREVSLDYISLFYFVARFLRFVSPFCYPYFERHFFARTQTCIWVLYVNVNKNPPNPATSLKKGVQEMNRMLSKQDACKCIAVKGITSCMPRTPPQKKIILTAYKIIPCAIMR